MGKFDRVGFLARESLWLSSLARGGNGTKDFGGLYSSGRLGLISEIHRSTYLQFCILRRPTTIGQSVTGLSFGGSYRSQPHSGNPILFNHIRGAYQ